MILITSSVACRQLARKGANRERIRGARSARPGPEARVPDPERIAVPRRDLGGPGPRLCPTLTSNPSPASAQAGSSVSSATPVMRCSGYVRTSSAVWSYAVTKPPSTRTGAMTRLLAAPSALT